MDSYFVRSGISEDEFHAFQRELYTIVVKELKELEAKGYESFNEYILWDIDQSRVHIVGESYAVPYPRKKNSWAIINQRREWYYKTAQWAVERNYALFFANFVCAGCGGTATQAHHQDWSQRFGNYKKVGRYDEDESLVPVCQHCHQVVTNIQNRKRWHTNPRKYPITLQPHREEVGQSRLELS